MGALEKGKVPCSRRSGQLRLGATNSSFPKGKSPSQEIDAIIKDEGGWKGKKLADLALIKKVDSDIIEEVKRKKPSNPVGLPVWSHDGIVCVGDILKKRRETHSPRALRQKTQRRSSTLGWIARKFAQSTSVKVTPWTRLR